MDKFDRIYALHGILNNRRTVVSMQDLMEQLEASRSSVKRLIEAMRNHLSAPIEYDRERNGYYYHSTDENQYQLPAIWFNTSELHALLTTQALLERVDPGLYSEQLRPLKNKITGLLDKTGHQINESNQRIRILSLAKRQFDTFRFQQLASATLERKQLHIYYHGRGDDNASQRDISPQRLVHYRDNWYLDAWCHNRNDYRTFAVERIGKAHRLDKPAKKISEQALNDYFTSAFGIFSGKARHTAVLRFTAERARWVAEEEWHPNQTTCWLDDGQYELRIPYGNPMELIMDILKYSTDVEVIAPASLRNEIKRRITGMNYIYQT